jgi:hypothetical protein
VQFPIPQFLLMVIRHFSSSIILETPALVVQLTGTGGAVDRHWWRSV